MVLNMNATSAFSEVIYDLKDLIEICNLVLPFLENHTIRQNYVQNVQEKL